MNSFGSQQYRSNEKQRNAFSESISSGLKALCYFESQDIGLQLHTKMPIRDLRMDSRCLQVFN